jgi:MFS transporter, FHS family, L-fucose permease
METVLRTQPKTRNLNILFTFGVLFFMWGLLTVLNFILVKHLTEIFHVNYSLSTLINLTFFSSYLIVSLPAGSLIHRVGYKKGIFYGWIAATMGCFFIFLSIYYRSYNLFLGALFILAGGITVLQVGANLYVVLLGDRNTAASRLTLIQGFNSLGTFAANFLGPLILIKMVNLPNEYLNSLDKETLFQLEFGYVHFPYLFLGILMVIFAVYLWFTYVPEIETTQIEPVNKITSSRHRHVMHFSQLRLGVFAIFAYVGAEVALGNYLEYFADQNVPYYWGLAMVGRFAGALVLLKVTPRNVIAFCAGINTILVAITIFTEGTVSHYAITFVGLFNSVLFPSIFALGVNGLGKFSIEGSAVLIMSIVGGAVIPFQVVNFSYASHQVPFIHHGAFIILVICYAYIVLYGLKFSRFEKGRSRGGGLE